MNADSGRPPRLLSAIIQASLPADDRALSRELEILWSQRAQTHGRDAANRWLGRQALGFVLRVGVSRMMPRAQTLDSLVSDARVSIRTMRREPTFILSFVLTLGMAAGVLAAVYSAANWVLLRPVPAVRDANQLFTMRLVAKNRPAHITWDVSQPDLATLRERLPHLVGLAAMTPVDVDVRVGLDAPRHVAAELATSNYFAVLRTRMFAGRAFAENDESDASDRVVVVAYSFARTISPKDPAATIGSDIRVNGALLRIVGVAEPEFRGAELPGRPLLWLSANALSVVDPSASHTSLGDRSFAVWRRMVGRVAVDDAHQQIATVANATVNTVRREFRRSSYRTTTSELRVFDGVGIDEGVRASVRRTLGLLLGAAAFLLCLAVANLTNLALTRALTRDTEMAVRLALGASRGRIVRVVVVETLILGACGGIAALVFAGIWNQWFQTTQLTEIGGSLEGMRIDVRVAGVTMFISLAAAAIAFVRPAVLARWRPLEQLMRRGGGRVRSAIFQTALVGLQVALSVVLLVAAMLLSRTVSNLHRVDLGFTPDGLFTMAADPRLHGFDATRMDEMSRGVERQLRDEPGVVSAGVISPPPLGSTYLTGGLQREDDAVGKDLVIGAGYYVTPGFLGVIGVHVLAGNASWQADSGTVVITREMVRQLFGNVPPSSIIGRTVVRPRGAKVREALRVAAVVADMKLSDLMSDAPPTLLLPMRDGYANTPIVVLARTAGAAMRVAPAVLRVMSRVAPDVPLYDARTARDAVDLQFIERRIMAVCALTLGFLGIALAAIGLYGVLANVVTARRREIAIRSALGATPRAILTHILVYGLGTVAVGTLIGTAGAVGAGRVLTAQLFGLRALDPVAFGLGLGAMVAVGAIACLLPAVRATRVPIIQMLRAD